MTNPVSIELNGRTYSGRYRVEKGIITVSTMSGSKSTQLGRLPEEALARMLLRELVDEEKV
ncbi:hypothetical protein D9M68_977530 [compost metagenome]